MRFKEDNAALEIIFPRDAKIFREGGTQYWYIYMDLFLERNKKSKTDAQCAAIHLAHFHQWATMQINCPPSITLKACTKHQTEIPKEKEIWKKKKHTHTIKQNRRWLWDMVCVCGCDCVFISIITAHITPLSSRAPRSRFANLPYHAASACGQTSPQKYK